MTALAAQPRPSTELNTPRKAHTYAEMRLLLPHRFWASKAMRAASMVKPVFRGLARPCALGCPLGLIADDVRSCPCKQSALSLYDRIDLGLGLNDGNAENGTLQRSPTNESPTCCTPPKPPKQQLGLSVSSRLDPLRIEPKLRPIAAHQRPFLSTTMHRH